MKQWDSSLTKSSHSELTSGKLKTRDKMQSEINTSTTSLNWSTQSRNKTDLNIRLDHQECKVVIQTWVKLITTIKMMVIRTCAEARDTSIVDVVANAEVVEIWKVTTPTATVTNITTRIRGSTTISTTTMVKWEVDSTSSNSSNSTSSNNNRCLWVWVSSSSRWINNRCHLSSRCKCLLNNSRCKCQPNKRTWCNFHKSMLLNLIHSKVMIEITLLVTTFTRQFMLLTEKNMHQPSLVCFLMKQQSITSCFWPRISISRLRLARPMSYSFRPSKVKSNKWQCSSKLLRTSEHYRDLLTITKIELIR